MHLFGEQRFENQPNIKNEFFKNITNLFEMKCL